MHHPMVAAIVGFADRQAEHPALHGAHGALNYGQLAAAIDAIGERLRNAAVRAVALALDNSPAWALLDLAALDIGVPVVPLPFFFSAEQVVHALLDSGADCLYTDRPAYYERLLVTAGIAIGSRLTLDMPGMAITGLRLQNIPARTLPPGTAKITYTSGTTGKPKGVCLGIDSLHQVAVSLLDASGGNAADRHLSLLPLATLLENIGGIYVPLLAGATCNLLPLAEVGMNGATGLEVSRMLAALSGCSATSAILTPEMLQGLIAAIATGHPAPAQLRFIALGGAPVAPRLLQRAQEIGLPVFEGYGLSECASVVALNTPGANCIGSVGRLLSHARLGFAADGEILVGGVTLLGYTGDEPACKPAGYWPTGDLGYLDDAGFLHITGRKKNVFITSFGRNVAPEWVERELALHPAITQAAVFGEARPWNVAVIVARGSSATVDQAIAEANRLLPDYAQVRQWIAAAAPFTPHNGQLTPNGRLRRAAIWSAYQATIDQLYEETTDVVL